MFTDPISRDDLVDFITETVDVHTGKAARDISGRCVGADGMITPSDADMIRRMATILALEDGLD